MLSFSEKGCFLWLGGVCAILQVLLEEKCLESWREIPTDVWSLIRFEVSHWTSISKIFCSYS